MAKEKQSQGSKVTDIGFASFYEGLEAAPDQYFILAAGLNGSGKTFFTGSWKDVLYLDFDNSKRTLQSCFPGKKDILVFDFKFGGGVQEGLDSLADRLLERKKPFDKFEPKTIVLDSVTSLCKFVEKELIDAGYESSGKDKFVPSLGDYRIIENTVMSFISKLKGAGCNLIVTTGLMWKTDQDTSEKIYIPAVSGQKLPVYVLDAFDFVIWFKGEVQKDGKKKYEAHYQAGEDFPRIRSRGILKKMVIENLDMKKFLDNVQA